MSLVHALVRQSLGSVTPGSGELGRRLRVTSVGAWPDAGAWGQLVYFSNMSSRLTGSCLKSCCVVSRTSKAEYDMSVRKDQLESRIVEGS